MLLKGVWHEIFDFRFFSYCQHFLIAGVNLKKKIISGVVDTDEQFVSGVVDTGQK
jgi:hypothetical protein